MRPNQILVRRYLRRNPKTPSKVVSGALRQLHRLGADKYLKHACRIQVTDKDSQVIPDKRLGFRRNACSIVNLGDQEPYNDVKNEVRAATTIYHESLHARDISERGEKGTSKENEISAHHETIEFLKDWKRQEKRSDAARYIDEEIDGERESIEELQKE